MNWNRLFRVLLWIVGTFFSVAAVFFSMGAAMNSDSEDYESWDE